MVKYVFSAMLAAMALVGGVAQAETIQGFPQNSGMAGLVEITIQGDPIPHSGILISQNLALTGRRWFLTGPLPRNVTVAHGHGPNRLPDTKVATNVWLHPGLDLALVRIASGFSGVPNISYGAIPATNAKLFCFGFSQGRDIKRAELRVQSSTPNGYLSVSHARTDMILNDGAGMPCFAEQNGQQTTTLTGIAISTAGADAANLKHTQVAASVFKDWIPNMIHLSKVRSTGARAMNLYIRPDPNNLNLRLCLDIPGSVTANTTVNQHTCNGGTNQLFYFHNFPDSRNSAATHYTIVHQNSGMCLDIPNASKNRGVKVQQYPCNQGLNQDWDQTIYQPRPPEGIKFEQMWSKLCLSAPAPPNSMTNSLPVEQNSCQNSATNFHQRWFIQWR